MKVSEAIEKLTVKRDDALHFQKLYRAGDVGWSANESKAIAFNIAINTLQQIDEPQVEKVEVTERQAQLLEAYEGETLYALLGECDEYEQELLAKAYLYGYTVMPKRWVVKDSDGQYVYDLHLNRVISTAHSGCDTKLDVLTFTNHAKAEAVAILVEGSVEEV
ncbi:hypothetical protein ACH0F8_000579 [Enterococcus hirae]